MNCCSSNYQNRCSCISSSSPVLWSKKKKIAVFEHQLECLNEKKKELEEALNELNNDA